MNTEDIIEALENAVISPTSHGTLGERANPTHRDILNFKRHIMRFLGELDAEITVGEIRGVLEEYD